MIIIDLFDIDFHIFTVIKIFIFNLGVRFKYIILILCKVYFYLTYIEIIYWYYIIYIINN